MHVFLFTPALYNDDKQRSNHKHLKNHEQNSLLTKLVQVFGAVQKSSL